MKYSHVQIGKDDKDNLVLHYYDIDGNRVKRKCKPHPLGFFYYPAEMSREEAGNILAKDQIIRRKKMIKEMEEDIKMLEKLVIK